MYEEETIYHENFYLKKWKWEAGGMQYTIWIYITLLDRSRVNWLQSEFLVEPFCLLLELCWNDFPCNLAGVAKAEKGPDEYLLFNYHTPLIWLFLLVWL